MCHSPGDWHLIAVADGGDSDENKVHRVEDILELATLSEARFGQCHEDTHAQRSHHEKEQRHDERFQRTCGCES